MLGVAHTPDQFSDRLDACVKGKARKEKNMANEFLPKWPALTIVSVWLIGCIVALYLGSWVNIYFFTPPDWVLATASLAVLALEDFYIKSIKLNWTARGMAFAAYWALFWLLSAKLLFRA